MDVKDYIIKASEQPYGSEIYIPCEHKKQQMKLRTKVSNMAEEYCATIDPGIFLLVKKVFKDRRHWVVIQKLKRTQAIFMKEKDDSKVVKIEPEDPEITRMIMLMRKDGYGEGRIKKIIDAYKENNSE